jgi:TetR/AcrR family transcriptional regulator, transcriptional repressor for nem operon
MEKQNTRELILNEALDSLHRSGYQATGLKDLLDRIQVPKGSFYHFFQSKEQLGLEVIKAYGEFVAKQWQKSFDELDGSAEERLTHYFKSLIQYFTKQDYGKGCLLGNLSLEMSDKSVEIRNLVNQSLDVFAKTIAKVLARDRGLNAKPNKTENLLADLIVEAWEGALIRMKSSKSKKPLEQFVEFSLPRILAMRTEH